MLLKKLKTICGIQRPRACYPKRGEKTKCGIFSLVETTIEGAKDIDIDAIASRSFRSISLPLIRRVFPELMAQNIVGVQAMITPVGLSFAKRFSYRDELELYNELV